MDSLVRLGRYVFAIAMAGLGAQRVIGVTAAWRELGPGPIWIPGNATAAVVFGAALIAGGVGIASSIFRRPAAAAVGTLLLAYTTVFYLPAVAANVYAPNPWTRGTEILAMSGMALAIAGWIDVGLVLCGLGVFVWAAQHFIYARITASLIPAWMPWHLAGAIGIGLVFLVSSVAFVLRRRAHDAALMLAAAFVGIVLIVHVQRVAGNLSVGREWTSAFIALAMLGGALAIAEGTSPLAPSRR